MLNDHLKPGLASAINCDSFEESMALVCRREDFIKIMSQDFQLAQAVIDQYSLKLRRTYRQLKNAPTNVSVEKKIAAKLYALCRDYGVKKNEGVLIDFPLTVTQLSEMLGMQRETVSRALQKLIKENLIVYEKKKIFIYNVNAIVCFYRDQLPEKSCQKCARESDSSCFFKNET